MTLFTILIGFIAGILSTAFMIGTTITLCAAYWDYQDRKTTKRLKQSTAHKALLERIEAHVGNREFDSPLEEQVN